LVKKIPPGEPAEGRDPSTERADQPDRATHSHDEESGFAAGLRRFSRRLATFGLGEAPKPLLTDELWSTHGKGDPR